MTHLQSTKKNYQKSKVLSFTKESLTTSFESYKPIFKVYRRDNSQTAKNYLQGLLICEKGQANMERMEEEVDHSEYRLYQHFISNSQWDYDALISKVAQDASTILSSHKEQTGLPTGYIIDESAHLKKGTESVGVSNQYAGVIGKVDNCQVGVYSSLVNDTRATIINERLFLPKVWITSKTKCDKAKIPTEYQEYQTKPALALSMIDQDLKRGVQFDWIGGDGLYGHNYELTTGLDQRGLFYVMDVHKDALIFLEDPLITIPKSTSNRGRKASKLKAMGNPLRLDQYLSRLSDKDWEEQKVRKTAKGWLKLKIHIKTGWIYKSGQTKAIKRTLVITKTVDKKPKIKYSISNGSADQYTPKEYAYFQCQRYWVERTFDDCKNELGMSDYQIRKWIGWHHHQSLVMLASLFLLKEKIENGQQYPLMSVRDARILMIVKIFGTTQEYRKRVQQMEERHKKRQKDIDRRYRYQELWEKEKLKS